MHWHTDTQMHTHMVKHAHTHMQIHTHMHTHTHTHAHAHTNTHMHAYGHTHSMSNLASSCPDFHMHMDTHTHMHTHTYAVRPTLPRLGIQLINNSPRVQGNTVEVDFIRTRPASKVTCQLGRRQQQDCKFSSCISTSL